MHSHAVGMQIIISYFSPLVHSRFFQYFNVFFFVSLFDELSYVFFTFFFYLWFFCRFCFIFFFNSKWMGFIIILHPRFVSEFHVSSRKITKHVFHLSLCRLILRFIADFFLILVLSSRELFCNLV